MLSNTVSNVLSILAIGFSIATWLMAWRLHRRRSREIRRVSEEIEALRRELDALSNGELIPALEGRKAVRRDRPRRSPIAGPILIEVPDLAVPAADHPGLPPEMAERFGGIWDLADSGASADAIARATGQPIGRIELILALRDFRPGEDG